MALKIHHILLAAELAAKASGLIGNALIFRCISNSSIALLVYLTTTSQLITSISRFGTDYSYQTASLDSANRKTATFLLFNIIGVIATSSLFFLFVSNDNAWGLTINQTFLGDSVWFLIVAAVVIESLTDLPWEVIQKNEKFRQFALRNFSLSLFKPVSILLGYLIFGELGIVIGFLCIAMINISCSSLLLRVYAKLTAYRFPTFHDWKAYFDDLRIGFFVWISILFSSLFGFPLLNKLQETSDSFDGLVGYRLAGILSQIILSIPAALTPLLLTRNSNYSVPANTDKENYYIRIRKYQLNMIALSFVLLLCASIFLEPIVVAITGTTGELDSISMRISYLLIIGSGVIASLLQFQQQRPDNGLRLYKGVLITIISTVFAFGLGFFVFVPRFEFLGYALTLYLFNSLSLILFLARDSFNTISLKEFAAIHLAMAAIIYLPLSLNH